MAVEQFPRKRVSRPHTEINVDTTGIGGASSSSDKTLMLIGSAKGGKPETVYRFRNYQQAKQTLRGGDLLDAIELAWNASDVNTASAGDILVVRVEDAKNATLTKGGLTFASTIYGADANEIQVALEENSLTETKRLTVAFNKDGYRKTFDNLGKIFSIQYKGSEAQASFTVEQDSVTKKANKLVLKTGTDAESMNEVMSFDLGQGVYAETNVLVSAINGLPDWEAKLFPLGDKNLPTATLEAVKDADVKAKAVYVEALAGDLIKQLEYNDYITVTADFSKPPVEFSLTNLAGGADGTVPESWADKFPLLANEGGYYLVPLTDKQAIHAEALAFVKDRSDNGDPMRVIVGGGSNETAEESIARATNLRDPRASLVGFSGTRKMDDGRLLKLPAYMMASQVAGIASGLEIGEAITFKHFIVTSLDRVFESSQLDMLNESGVISVEFVRNRTITAFRIVQDVTTYNDKTDPVKNEMSVGEANDFLVSELKIELDNTFIGTKIVDTSASLIKNFIQSFLDGKKRAREIQDYTPEEVQVVLEGDVASISMTVMPIRSLNKVTVQLVYKQQILTA
nr:MAG TPA: tail sheath protein [Herelleviridae sp.]